ncbi:hypothetical protein Hanom_Chr13g01190681 [Helianthus anomalus]
MQFEAVVITPPPNHYSLKFRLLLRPSSPAKRTKSPIMGHKHKNRLLLRQQSSSPATKFRLVVRPSSPASGLLLRPSSPASGHLLRLKFRLVLDLQVRFALSKV